MHVCIGAPTHERCNLDVVMVGAPTCTDSRARTGVPGSLARNSTELNKMQECNEKGAIPHSTVHRESNAEKATHAMSNHNTEKEAEAAGNRDRVQIRRWRGA